MPLVSSKQLLLDAQKNRYAIGAFNVENMEMVMAVLQAAEETMTPVLLQTTPSTLKYAGPEVFAGIVVAAAKKIKTPIALHLDHGNSYELVMRAIDAGYTSVMIDGSAKSFDENVELTCRVVEKAHALDIPVEAELGIVGGKEDEIIHDDSIYTRPEDASKFAELTQVDSLAVAIGTAHGIYKSEPKVDVNRLAEIRELVSIPLVLHGTSGVPEDVVAACVNRGICKVNYATDLRIAYTNGVKAYMCKDANVFDPKKYGRFGMDYVKEYVIGKMKLLGSFGKA